MISALIRKDERDKDDNIVSKYINTGPDHWAFARVYSEIALPIAVSGLESGNIDQISINMYGLEMFHGLQGQIRSICRNRAGRRWKNEVNLPVGAMWICETKTLGVKLPGICCPANDVQNTAGFDQDICAVADGAIARNSSSQRKHTIAHNRGTAVSILTQ